ncbi:hypothetical protein EYF80_020683 [Liparis tanakae]|uniref:Uncharacterized protein n=1 Tax=Liparis tanakae TaxID=230148 RepID=A0A4Z2HTX1_9TELE|nr:hypothetical protein EYF80_020683 [Liparis tanakae]
MLHEVVLDSRSAEGFWSGGQVTSEENSGSVPDVAVEVVVAGQEQAATLGEGHRGDAADDVVMAVHHQLLVGTQVKQPAGGVV